MRNSNIDIVVVIVVSFPPFRSCPKRAAVITTAIATTTTTIGDICLCRRSWRTANLFCNTTVIRSRRQLLLLSAMGEVVCVVWYALPPGTWLWWACRRGTRRRRHTPRTMWRQSGKQASVHTQGMCVECVHGGQTGESPVCTRYRYRRRFMGLHKKTLKHLLEIASTVLSSGILWRFHFRCVSIALAVEGVDRVFWANWGELRLKLDKYLHTFKLQSVNLWALLSWQCC